MPNTSPAATVARAARRHDPRLIAIRWVLRRQERARLAAVLALCDRMDADPMNGGVVLTSAVRAAARTTLA